jgi:hypothetical protein
MPAGQHVAVERLGELAERVCRVRIPIMNWLIAGDAGRGFPDRMVSGEVRQPWPALWIPEDQAREDATQGIDPLPHIRHPRDDPDVATDRGKYPAEFVSLTQA